MKIYLRDRNKALCDAWSFYFYEAIRDGIVDVSCGNIFDPGPHMQADAIVSPANSFVFMNGGIDLVYTRYFGTELQANLQDAIRQYGGELLVGNACMLEIPNSKDIKYLISAPTMRVPEDVSNTVNAYLAFKAALTVAKSYGKDILPQVSIKSILCPGLATTTGKMSAIQCAYQMIEAFWSTNKNGNLESSLDYYATLHKIMKDKRFGAT